MIYSFNEMVNLLNVLVYPPNELVRPPNEVVSHSNNLAQPYKMVVYSMDLINYSKISKNPLTKW